MRISLHFFAAVLTTAVFLAPPAAFAHCDTLDGPIVTEARAALEKGDVTPLLKWVGPADEQQIRKAFDSAVAVRKQGAQARELADTWFFETLVRIHREHEGAVYSGLKPAGQDFGPAIAGADKALESGSVDALKALITSEAGEGIEHRFRHAMETKKHANDSVAAGREWVEAYAQFLHYAERLHDDATHGPSHGEQGATAEHRE